jgi:hypothetical protein
MKREIIDPYEIGTAAEEFFKEKANQGSGYTIDGYTFTKPTDHRKKSKRPDNKKGLEYDFFCGLKDKSRTQIHVEIKVTSKNTFEVSDQEFKTGTKLGYGEGYVIVKYRYNKKTVYSPEKWKVCVVGKEQFANAKSITRHKISANV